nr:hypothetical protein Itr_chr09CG06250 [Ipomoea trifida]
MASSLRKPFHGFTCCCSGFRVSVPTAHSSNLKFHENGVGGVPSPPFYSPPPRFSLILRKKLRESRRRNRDVAFLFFLSEIPTRNFHLFHAKMRHAAPSALAVAVAPSIAAGAR